MRNLATGLFFVLCLSGLSTADELGKYSASGRDGANGAHGTTWTGSAGGYGSDGRNGGDAGPAERGQDSGDIHLQLSEDLFEPLKGVAVLEGEVMPAGGGRKEIKTKVRFGDKGYIYLYAFGGDGGRGGDGGNGQGGGDGRPGSDATRYSSGGNGGPGGDGGDGGDATSGAEGGKGGKIVVSLPENDTHLVMLVKTDVHGGRGGDHGVNGKGGSGGDGGRGGSSYSWTESHTRSVSDGKGGTRTETYTTFHSNPGGSRGSNGSRGRDGNAHVVRGADAPGGTYRVRVQRADGTYAEYESPYDLKLLGFAHNSENNDGIYEPGERATVTRVKLKNTGGMPTPPNHEARVYLANSEWVISGGERLVIPKSLAPGEEYEFPVEKLTFTVKDTTITKPGSRFLVSDMIRPLSYLADVERPFEQFENSQKFEVTFPVEITPITALESMGPGQASKVHWLVKNISGKDFGSLSELKREIAVKFRLTGGDLTADDLVFLDDRKAETSLETGLFRALENLKAGDSRVIEGTVGIRKGTRLYSDARLTADLELGKIDSPADRRTIHLRELSLRVAQTYGGGKGADLLLVANHESTRGEVEAWKAFAEAMGMKVDVWDVSLNGFLSLSRELKAGGTLMEHFRGKTIVLLNNTYVHSSGEVRAATHLAERDFLKAAGEYGINFYVVGEDPGLESYLIPTEGERTATHKSPKHYLKALADEEKKKDTENKHEEWLANRKRDFTVLFEDVAVTRWGLGWGKPKKEYIERVSARLQRKLSEMYPERRYVIVHKFDASLLEKAWGGIFKKWKHGGLEIRRTLDTGVGNAVALTVADEAMHSDAFVTSRENLTGFFLAMDLDQKLKLLDRFASNEFGRIAEAGDALIDALIVELATEAGALASAGFDTPGGKRFARRFVAFQKLLAHKFPSRLDSRSEAGKLLIRLAAELRYFAETRLSWWNFFIVPDRRHEARKLVRGMADQLLKNAFLDHRTGDKRPYKEARALMKSGLEDLYAMSKADRKKLKKEKKQKVSKRDYAERLVLEPLLREGIMADTELARADGERVLSDAKHAEFTNLEQRRAEQAAALEQAKDTAYSELNATRECEALLTRATARFTVLSGR